jgi:cobalt-zinc-cadmium efflux system membrane fusion protein
MKSAILLLGMSAAIGAAGCGSSGSAPVAAQPASASNIEYVAPDAKGIQTLTVQATPIPDYLDLPAHIEADPTQVVHVFPPAGGRIIEMKVKPSDRVTKGQTLAVLESGDLSRAVSDYHKALADNEVKQKALARSEDLLAHHAIAERDYQQAQADAQMAAAELDSTREQIRVFGMDPEHASTELRVAAPRAGVVLDVGAAPGEFSNALAALAPLATIADISSVWVVGDLYEKDFSAVKAGEGAQVMLNAYPERHWTGRVSVVSDAVDPTTRTLHVRVVMQNPDGYLKPAMFGTIRLLRSSAPGILVPTSAVIREGNNSYLYVGKGNNRYERRSVTLGRVFDGSLEIAKGVNAGDTIVSEGALLLRQAAQD